MIIVLTGPTCTGKSKTAVHLAKIFNAEIINGDAFQIYKQLNIGVAKPELSDMEEISHHLYSFLNVDIPYSIKEYQHDLRRIISALERKNKNIIIVGGSMLYIRAGLYDYKFSDDKNNQDYGFDEVSNEQLHDLLSEIDPVDAEKIHPNNRKRMIRALTIYKNNGKSKTELNKDQTHKPIYDCRFFYKNIDRELLYENINNRVDEMFQNGLVDEVKDLLNNYDKNIQSLMAIGYKEVISYLCGEISLLDAIELTKKHTRNYAKRQITFLKHQFDFISSYDNDEQLIEEIRQWKAI